ncbi:hypothetical protein MyNCGM70_39700 [Achromobacter xylosoxidans]
MAWARKREAWPGVGGRVSVEAGGAAPDGDADMQAAPGSNAKAYGSEAPGGLQDRHSDEGLILLHEARRADQTERVMPPSMRMFCPVMYEEASEARKAIRSATSSAVP